jgi:diacylglycerol O-acyltransferase
MNRLRPDDHFMILTETDASPMHIGALQYFAVRPEERAAFADRTTAHLVDRLPSTPLMRSLRQAPRGYDSDVWLDGAQFDPARHITRQPPGEAMGENAVRDFVACWSVERIALSRPPFQVHLLDRLADGRCAMLIKVHHALADGVGFQSILEMLADDAEMPTQVPRSERPPPAPLWLARAWWRFRREKLFRKQAKQSRGEALAAIKLLQADPATRRLKTPALRLSGPTTPRRRYATLSLSLPAIKAVGRALDATVNDMFLAVVAAALRGYLIEIGDLPDAPLITSAARSYRKPEHGALGNRIVALNPSLATDVAEPLARLRAIQASLANEMLRTPYDEAMLDQPETPFGPRDRRRKFAALTETGAAISPGNVTLSNVPGPARRPAIAGFQQQANFPIPLLASRRFLNITLRRGGDMLDLGIMADADKITDLPRLVALLEQGVVDYAELATSR